MKHGVMSHKSWVGHGLTPGPEKEISYQGPHVATAMAGPPPTF